MSLRKSSRKAPPQNERKKGKFDARRPDRNGRLAPLRRNQRQAEVKPGSKLIRLLPHAALKVADFEPLPGGDFARIGKRIAVHRAQQDLIEFMLDAASLRIDSAINEFRSNRQVAIKSHLFAQPSSAGVE